MGGQGCRPEFTGGFFCYMVKTICPIKRKVNRLPGFQLKNYTQMKVKKKDLHTTKGKIIIYNVYPEDQCMKLLSALIPERSTIHVNSGKYTIPIDPYGIWHVFLHWIRRFAFCLWAMLAPLAKIKSLSWIPRIVRQPKHTSWAMKKKKTSILFHESLSHYMNHENLWVPTKCHPPQEIWGPLLRDS